MNDARKGNVGDGGRSSIATIFPINGERRSQLMNNEDTSDLSSLSFSSSAPAARGSSHSSRTNEDSSTWGASEGEDGRRGVIESCSMILALSSQKEKGL